MDPSQPFSPGRPPNARPELDPRLQPTPDYGTLGPGSDVGTVGPGPQSNANAMQAARVALVLAAGTGMLAALLVGMIGKAHPKWPAVAQRSSQQDQPADARQLDNMGEQKQAETLLQLAVAQNPEAPQQISSRLDSWQGKLEWDSRMATLTTAALNSDDMRVRESGVEVELAAYGLAKNSASVDYLLKTSQSQNHSQKIWALWALGLMANRGVEADQVVRVLISHLQDSDDDSRHWAVEALALSGSDQSIKPLLQSMHDDRSALVRERAACGLAQSGLFTPEQRMTAVPQLLNYTDDPTLDAQTHAWAFHALSDITHQHLPNDSSAWRTWYESGSQ
jgi:HEAT repeats